MKKATATRGLPILEIAGGTTVGKVQKLIIDPKTKSVVYLTLSENTLVKLADCVGVGNDCVVIRSKDAVRKIYDDREIAEAMDSGRDIAGLRVISDEGNIIGEVADFEYDNKGGALLSVEFDNGLATAAAHVLSISSGLMFVSGTAAAPIAEAPACEAPAQAAETEAAEDMDDDDAYLLGKRLNGDVMSDDEQFLAVEGTIITADILKAAKAHDAVLKLALLVD